VCRTSGATKPLGLAALFDTVAALCPQPTLAIARDHLIGRGRRVGLRVGVTAITGGAGVAHSAAGAGALRWRLDTAVSRAAG
jgi:hypothetical protein